MRETVARLIEEMEQPLDDVADLICVLDLVGYGFNTVRERSGQPVLAVSAAISERFCAACESWNRLLKPWRAPHAGI